MSGTDDLSRRRPGLILDRDGVINVDTGFVHEIEACTFVDGIFDLVRAARAGGFALAIATNQSGIGRGHFSEAAFSSFMEWMQREFDQHASTRFDRIYHCSDHPTEGIGVYRRENDWRKPGPGMFRQAIADLTLDPAASWAIGDNPHDLEAAQAAGIAHRVLLAPQAKGLEWRDTHWITPSLAFITEKIVEISAA